MAEGIPCIVFRRELEEACPDLPDFLSQAGNQSHDVHSKETKLQLMIWFAPVICDRKESIHKKVSKMDIQDAEFEDNIQ